MFGVRVKGGLYCFMLLIVSYDTITRQDSDRSNGGMLSALFFLILFGVHI